MQTDTHTSRVHKHEQTKQRIQLFSTLLSEVIAEPGKAHKK